MNHGSCNCIVCAKEFNPSELTCLALSKINVTRFKICEDCFNICDPEDDYKQVKNIVNSYLELSNAKHLFKEAREIIESIKK